ncbi:MAG: NHL repeat-containing protein [Acidimicrobiales bacterium]
MASELTSTSLNVRPSRPGESLEGTDRDGDVLGGARPTHWMGAEAAGGLTLPDALPTPHQMYAPRGVWLDDQRLIVADTGNHRLLIWHGAQHLDSHGDADVVLGQPDFTTEGAQAGGRGSEAGLRLPTGVLVHDGRLVVADAWNHRILIWNEVPTISDTEPDVILGQPDPTSVMENRGGGCGPLGFYWPFGIAMVGDVFYVADTGNRRVLAWDGLPDPDDQPDLVLGQPAADQRDENRGELGPDSFRWPHDIASAKGIVFIADAGNHRVLGWKPKPDMDRPADTVLGQSDFVTGSEWPYSPQTAKALRFPYAIDIEHETMVVADTANNRILVWDEVPLDSTMPANRVLGQPTFASNGENRWDRVAADTFCWPYGLCLHRGRVAVTDSGNNRVTIWDLG